MDPTIYAAYFKFERYHWWNLGKLSIVESLVRRYCSQTEPLKLIDIGAGTGSYAEFFAKKGMMVEAHDGSPLAMPYLRDVCAHCVQKKFPDDYRQCNPEYDVVLLLDMIEHLQDDRSGIDAALRLLKPGGILLCTVPACKRMWGEYDVVAHHYRRYDLSEVRELVKDKRARIEKISYYSTLLFPFLFTVRFFENMAFRISRRAPVYRPHFLPGFFNFFLKIIFSFEKYLIKFMDFPFGSSIVLVCRKL